MTSIRKLLLFVLAIALSAFALPVVAGSGTKNFYAEFPQVAPAANPQTVSTIIHNESSAPGVSTINSMQFTIVAPAGVTITAIQMTAPTVMTPTMTPSTGGTQVVITNFPGIKNHDQATFKLTLSGVPSTCTTVQFAVDANSGNAYPGGDEFQKIRTDLLTTGVGCDGVLKCPSLPSSTPGLYSYTEISGQNTTQILRNENKDGSVCVPVTFNVTITSSGSDPDRNVEVTWSDLQPFASMETVIVWPLKLVQSNGWPSRTRYSLDGVNYVDAPMCLSSIPPTSYGTLAAAITGTPASFGITAASLPTAPFAIVIPSSVAGTDPERILVKAYTGPVSGVYTVTNFVRGTGGTPITDHAASAPVMSTPLPVIGGVQHTVCVVDELYEVQPFGTAGCPAQPAQTTQDALLGCYKATSTLYMLKDIKVSGP